ncbi:ANTAR domain-containing protein [Streptomyces minutiscleroticus]|uniref:ANTAR domain-containing protein n=1 Tax=Streptomyces minutiscleroticus TaxID=68238 RepID=UPI00332EDAF5
MSREEKIARTFVELADTLVDDFDVIDFLQQLTVRCCEIFTVADTAVLLAYPRSQLHSPAPCDPSPALAAVLDEAVRAGPALDAYRTGTTIAGEDLTRAPAGWDDFTQQAQEAGYTHACAVPLRLRRQTLGSLLLLSTTPDPLPADDLTMARAFADAATIGLLHARTLPHTDHTDAVNEQLHTVLHSRITIEQAKGFLAAEHHIPLDAAFTSLHRHARHHRMLLTTVAHHVVTGQLPPPPPAPCPPADHDPRHRAEDTSTE